MSCYLLGSCSKAAGRFCLGRSAVFRTYSSSSSPSQPQPEPHYRTSRTAQHHHPHKTTDRQFILDVLNAKPSQREARQFLKRFNQLPAAKGAAPLASSGIHYRDLNTPLLASAAQLGLVSLKHDVSDTQLPGFAGTLIHLCKLGLTPVVVIDDGTADGGDSNNGHIISKATRDVILARLFRIVDLVDSAGGRAMALYTGIFSQSASGEVAVDLSAVNTALSLGHIPVLATFARTETHAMRSIPARSALVALSRGLTQSDLPTPLKTIIVNRRGGLASARDGAPIGFVNLEDEYEEVVGGIKAAMASTTGDAGRAELLGMRRDLDTVRDILDVLPSSSSAVIASVASSAALISNLITDKPPNPSLGSAQSMSLDIVSASLHGSEPPASSSALVPTAIPTVLRQGLRVAIYRRPDWESQVDAGRLVALLAKSFQKELQGEPFRDRMRQVLHSVIVAGSYDGAAIVTYEPNPLGKDLAPLPYLDKFAVAPTSQGIGVADILWKQLRKLYPNLCWRSRATNPVNKWYFERCEGNMALQGSPWQLFWYGDGGLENLKAYAHMARDVPASFYSK